MTMWLSSISVDEEPQCGLHFLSRLPGLTLRQTLYHTPALACDEEMDDVAPFAGQNSERHCPPASYRMAGAFLRAWRITFYRCRAYRTTALRPVVRATHTTFRALPPGNLNYLTVRKFITGDAPSGGRAQRSTLTPVRLDFPPDTGFSHCHVPHLPCGRAAFPHTAFGHAARRLRIARQRGSTR